jgi:CubicO group peptidase (beta-lactamase class C family)
VPENSFTATQKVTLRRLMSHSAGVTVHGFDGYAVGQPLPTLLQILNGEKPANSAPIRVDSIPGSQCLYSGGGITIERQLMMDVTGQPFEDFMRKTVLEKAGMSDSTFAQPLPAALAERAATATRIDGKAIEGRWHIYPELAADGLWTTPTDLARFAIETALSKQGKANHILSEKMTREMLTPQAIAGDESFGLGFGVGDADNPTRFGHGGSNEGFESQLFMEADTGRGMAIMGNSDAFFLLMPYVMESIAKSSGWKLPPAKHYAIDNLVFIQALRGTQAALDAYQRMKQNSFAGLRHGPDTLNRLGYRLLGLHQANDAIKVFQLGVAEYPKDANAYDSLGEAYRDAGQKDLAIKNYETSLRLDPNNENGKAQLAKLRAK